MSKSDGQQRLNTSGDIFSLSEFRDLVKPRASFHSTTD